MDFTWILRAPVPALTGVVGPSVLLLGIYTYVG